LVVELNPRVINSWLFIIARKLFRRRTAAWGHVFPRSGPSSRTDKIRSVMRRMIDEMIVYTEQERADYTARHPGQRVLVASNAIYPSAALTPVLSTGLRRSFVVIGRLVAAKKPGLALEAFSEFVASHP